MTTIQKLNNFRAAYASFLKAKRENNPWGRAEPTPAEYHLAAPDELFLVEQIRREEAVKLKKSIASPAK